MLPPPPGRRELLLLLAILALAAVLRLPGLDQRGRWDADQGHDMLVLRALVTDGELPLLGPPTSIGTFHHGAAYYYLLAPAALVSGSDPVAVTAELAMIGIGAVAAVWWLARLVGGPTAALAAGLLAAVSPAGIDESTFIWNPNPIPLTSAVTFGAVILAWRTRATRWWLLAALGAMLTSQLHVLGIVVLPPLLVVWLADLRRRAREPGATVRPLILAGLAGLAILALGYVPLAVHELGHDFSETRAILAYLAAGGGSSEVGPLGRLVLVGLRGITWPLIGLLTDRPAGSVLAAFIAIGLMGVASLTAAATVRRYARWLVAVLAWSIVALAIGAPSLATVTPGLPNDHYHAFLDPLVLALCGVGLATLAGWPVRRAGAGVGGAAGRAEGDAPAQAVGGASAGYEPRVTPGGLLAGGLLVALVVLAVVSWPPAVADDGGWRLVDEAAARVIADATGASAVALDGIPPFKSADALRFPLERRGLMPSNGIPVDSAATGASVVVVCDPLFESVVGAACGGPVEDAEVAAADGAFRLVDRFAAGPRRFISVYGPATP